MAFWKNTKKKSLNLFLSISVPRFTLRLFIYPDETELTLMNFGGKNLQCKFKKQIIVKEKKNKSSAENHRFGASISMPKKKRQIPLFLLLPLF